MDDTETLRDRKARQTRESIHAAAVNLAFEHGLEQATIAGIAAAADISQRTLFNYFATKEDAVVGTVPNDFSTTEIRDFPEWGSFAQRPLETLARILRRLLIHSAGSAELTNRRKAVIYRNPELLRHRTEWVGHIHEKLVTAVETRLDSLDIDSSTDPEGLARILIHIAASPLHLNAWRHQCEYDAGTEPGPPPDRFEESLSLLRTVLSDIRS